MRYRTKIVYIEAFEWDPNANSCPGWFYAAIKNGDVVNYVWPDGKEELKIKTLEGDMTVNKGDMIIQGLKGELYPCKLDIFHMKYEPA